MRQMTAVSALTTVVVVLVVVITTAMWIFNDRIMSIGFPKWIRLVVATAFPPGDLFAFIAREELDLSQAGAVKEVSFLAKYRGQYDTGILLRNFDSDKFYGTKYNFPLRLKLTFQRGSTFIISKVVGAQFSPFIGRDASGFGLFTFSTPEDLPIGEEITCRIEIVSSDPALNSRYGPAEFFVRKISDK